MRRAVIIISFLAVLCLAAWVTWIGRKHTEQDDNPALKGALGNEQTSHQSSGSNERAALNQRVFELPMRVTFFGDDEAGPCYVDLNNKILYRWKGVILRREQIRQTPYAGVPSGIRMPDTKDFSVIPIEAPVKYWYWKDGEGYRPGYLDRTIWTFYAWKDIILNEQELLEKSQDGQDTILKPAFHIQVIGVIEIDMPAHLKEKPELWKKGGAYNPDAAIPAEKRAAEKKAAEKRAAEERARDPRVFTLGVWVTTFGENEFSPCYYDPKYKSLYHWKGVVLRLEQLPEVYKKRQKVLGDVRSLPLLVVPVEAPVKYREVKGGYRPGYVDSTCQTFYEWKGVVLNKQEVLDKSKDGQPAIVAPANVGQVIEIDMPAHLKEQPRLWKKT